MTAPIEWLPLTISSSLPVTCRRIVLHWTVGNGEPSPHDAEFYNLLISGLGSLFQGKHPIYKNSELWDGYKRGDYAAHVGKDNQGSIGIALCGMVGAVDPWNIGKVPLTQAQWDSAVTVCAQLCRRYSIPTNEQGIMGHCEVKRVRGIPQGGKWDPWFPFAGIKQTQGLPMRNWGELDRSQRIIGDRFRQEVAEAMTIKKESK